MTRTEETSLLEEDSSGSEHGEGSGEEEGEEGREGRGDAVTKTKNSLIYSGT